jgi:hypothetical protein
MKGLTREWIARSKFAWVLAVMLAGIGFGAGTPAQAHHCGDCGPVPPSYTTYRHHTVNRVSHVTRYHDRVHTHYVHRVHRIVDVTVVRPILYVHHVTRIHERQVAVFHTVHSSVAEVLPTRVYSSSSVVHVGCGCGGY